MSSRIKGITVEIGGSTAGLDKALSGVNKKINTTQAELRDVEKLLKLDPKNTILLQQKQQLLAKSVEDTKEKLDSLKKANEQATDSVKNYDAWKAVYDPIQQEIDATQKKLKELKEAQKEISDIEGIETEEYKKVQEEIAETAKQLKELKQQAKDVSEEFGNPISNSQYDALQREIIDTENNLKKLENEAEKTENAIKGIDDDPLKDVARAADEAEEQLEQAGKEASNFGDYLKAEALVEGAKGLLSGLKDIAEESKELNMDLSKLDQNARESSVGIDAAREAFREFAAQSGETDSAIEGVSNLLQAGFTESNLQKAVEGLSGAALRFPDTLKIESLADSLQETLATGSATGQFAELLDRLGVNAESFSEELAKCGTEAEKQNMVLQMLSEQGLNDSYNAWKKNNEALYESNQAQLELQEQTAELGEVLMPLFTQLTEITTGLLEVFNGLDDNTQRLVVGAIALVAVLGPGISMIGGISGGITGMSNLIGTLTTKVLPALQSGFSTVFGFIAANPVVLLIAAIVAMVALIAAKGTEIQEILQSVDDFLQNVFATDWTNVFGPVLGEILNTFWANLKNVWDSVYLILNGVIDFIQGVFTGDWERAWNGVKEIFSGIFGGLVAIAKIPINGVIGLLNMAIGAVNSMISGFNSIGFDLPEWLGGGSWHPDIPTISKIAYLAKGGILTSGTAVVGEAGPEILTVTGGKAMVQPLTGSAASGNSLSELMGLLSMYLPYLAETKGVYLDTGVMVGEMAPAMNEKLGELSDRERNR